MKKSTTITLIVITCILAIIILVTWNANRGINLSNIKIADTIQIEKGEWEEYKSILIEDSILVYQVTWDQKYGVTKTEYCKVIFKNDKQKQYKLIAPWLDGVIIERVNMNDLSVDKINLNDVPKSYWDERK